MSHLRSFRYCVVDVFTDRPLEGNPIAVFPDAEVIDDLTMQKIAKELNLSETTFVVPATRSDCAVGVRIFTPGRELPFAGHPTIGTAFVLLEEGRVSAGGERLVLEEKIGPVAVRVDKGENPLIWLRTPAIEEGQSYDRQLCAHAVGLDPADLLPIAPQLLSAGNPTIFIPLKDKDAVDRAWLDAAGCAELKNDSKDSLCVFVFTPTVEGAYSRMFAPDYGIAEDPATGSSTGPLACFMMRHGLVSSAADTRFISEQGAKMARRSILHVHIFGESGRVGIEVGGHVTPVARATMTLYPKGRKGQLH
jgi:trans-2,3-dihydro-3-hydroxyanthranilate isomerase